MNLFAGPSLFPQQPQNLYFSSPPPLPMYSSVEGGVYPNLNQQNVPPPPQGGAGGWFNQ